MTFAAPVDPAGWTFEIPGVFVVPPGLRFGGVRLRSLRATRLLAAEVRVPVTGILRSVVADLRTIVEVQANPFVMRVAAQAVPFGLPTFYLVFEPGTTFEPFSDGDMAPAGEPLATVAEVQIVCVGQDRLARDPALWARLIATAGAPDGWDAFADAVETATAGPDPPVLLLDHAGAPVDDGAVEITVGPTTVTATLTPDDHGDVQRAIARMHAADPGGMPLTSLFASGSTARLRPAGTDIEIAAVDDGLFAAASLEATAQRRHLAFTDLRDWFAPQFASPVAGTPLPDYSRGNRFTPFVNGKPYFDDLFERLRDAATAARDGLGGGLHLVGGWKTFPDEQLTEPQPHQVGILDLPTTLVEAATLLDSNGGATRFLSPQFIQLDPGSSVETAELIFVSTLIGVALAGMDVDFLRSDPAGAVILIGLFAANAIAIDWIVSTDGRALEPNADMLELFSSLPSVESTFGPHPATVEDNPAAPPLSGFPFDQLVSLIRHFGFYHQKFVVVAAGERRYAYCGGIDINPNRLDDARHLQPGPYHDVHAKIEGPAARDVEVSFQQRWSRDGGGTSLAFQPDGDYGAVGDDVVQVARTYFKAADPSRRLNFAPNGDRTILDTMLRAISHAREYIYIADQYFTPPAQYCDALVSKVASGDIGALVVAMPSSPDQPFGEVQRYHLVDRLREADGGRGIVRIGYPRRHYTVADNQLRASSGRLVLLADLPAAAGVNPSIVLGPKSRLPQPPFWVAAEGELMYAYNESISTNPDPTKGLVFDVVRGGETRLFRGGPITPASGPRPREHKAGAAATVVSFSGIYVHAKMMIVDDVFIGIGSANLNRRGLCHDGEITAFSVPQQLRTSPANPAAALRRQLWAEMLDLPMTIAGPLLADPIAAARLFDRAPFEGNRFTDVDAVPAKLMWDATGGDGILLNVLRALLVDDFIVLDHQKIFDAIVDPTSAVETT